MIKYILILNFYFIFLLSYISLHTQNIPNNSEYCITYSSDISGNPEIYLTDIKGKKRKQLTNYPGRDGYPSCSPDGKKVAFYSYHNEGKTWSIQIMDINGKNRKRITHTPNIYDTSLVWSANGIKIIFGRDNKDALEVWLIKPDGTNLHQVKNISGGTPSFTSNGNIMYCSHWKPHGEITIANKKGVILKKITSNNIGEWFAEISPKGDKIVYVANDDIYTINSDGSNSVRLLKTEQTESSPHWSPDENKILFTSNMDGDYDIYIMDKNGKNLTKNT